MVVGLGAGWLVAPRCFQGAKCGSSSGGRSSAVRTEPSPARPLRHPRQRGRGRPRSAAPGTRDSAAPGPPLVEPGSAAPPPDSPGSPIGRRRGTSRSPAPSARRPVRKWLPGRLKGPTANGRARSWRARRTQRPPAGGAGGGKGGAEAAGARRGWRCLRLLPARVPAPPKGGSAAGRERTGLPLLPGGAPGGRRREGAGLAAAGRGRAAAVAG